MVAAAQVEGPGASVLIVVGAVVIDPLTRCMGRMSFLGQVPEILDTFYQPWNQHNCEHQDQAAGREMWKVGHRFSS